MNEKKIKKIAENALCSIFKIIDETVRSLNQENKSTSVSQEDKFTLVMFITTCFLHNIIDHSIKDNFHQHKLDLVDKVMNNIKDALNAKEIIDERK